MGQRCWTWPPADHRLHQVENQTEGDLDALSRQVQEHIGKMVQDVKAYLDLDLHMAQFAMSKSINDLVPERA